MTINFDLDTMFTNTQKLATLIKDDPNPHRTAYVRLIGELEAVILNGYRSSSKATQKAIADHLATIIRRQREELAKREEVARRLVHDLAVAHQAIRRLDEAVLVHLGEGREAVDEA